MLVDIGISDRTRFQSVTMVVVENRPEDEQSRQLVTLGEVWASLALYRSV